MSESWKRLLTYDELVDILPENGSQAYNEISWNNYVRILGTDRNEIIFPRAQSWYSNSVIVHKYGTGSITSVTGFRPETYAHCAFWINPFAEITTWYSQVSITSNRAKESESAGYDYAFYTGTPAGTLEATFGSEDFTTGALAGSANNSNSMGQNWPTISDASGGGLIAQRSFPFNFGGSNVFTRGTPFFIAIKERDGGSLASVGTAANVSINVSLIYTINDIF